MNSFATAQLLEQARNAAARGDLAACLDQAQDLLKWLPDHAEAAVLAVNAALQLQRWDSAAVLLEPLVHRYPERESLRRNLVSCLLRIGNLLNRDGKPADAEATYRRALELDPQNLDARYNVALQCMKSSRPDEVLQILGDAPAGVDASMLRARALIALDRTEEAAPILTTAGVSDIATVRWRCAELLSELPDVAAAMELVCALPDPLPWREAWALGESLRRNAESAAATALLDRAYNTCADSAGRFRLHLARSLGLSAVHDSAHAVREARTAFDAGLATLMQEYPPTRVRQLGLDPAVFNWENFFLAYQGENDRDLQQRFGSWQSDCLHALMPQHATAPQAPQRARPRVLLVSSYWRNCTIGAYFQSWAGALRDSGFETIVVQLGTLADAWTETIGSAAGELIRLDGPLPEVARRIAELEADLIIYPELGMDGRTLWLAALRLAARQACAWGHPSTPGLPTIDAFFSCAEMEPPDAAAHYREPLRLLPGIGTVYAAPSLPPLRSRGELGLPLNRTLYLLPQSPFKLHPDVDAVVVDIVQRDPTAQFVLFTGSAHGATVHLQRRLRGALLAAGCDPVRSLHWLPMCPRDTYLAVNQACDVMLDSLRWSGGNASIDALACGLPLITCPGALMRGRQSSAMLRKLQRTEWIADTPQQQAELAVSIARQRRTYRDRTDHVGISEGIAALLGDPLPLHVMVEQVRELLTPSR